MESRTKKVRFANVPPQTPSPSSSSTSFGSSPEPFTPPQLPTTHLSPMVVRPPEYPPWQHYVPTGIPGPMPVPMAIRTAPMTPPPYFPALFNAEPEEDVVIDPLIAAPLYPSHPPPLRWDVSSHPNAIELGSVDAPGARQLSHDDLASCAVYMSKGSPMKLRRLTLVFPGLPLTVDIEPDNRPVWTAVPVRYLTVGNVLYGLYRALRLSVEPREFEQLSRAQREEVSRAFDMRVEGDRANVDRNVQHGIRRVDYLGEVRAFVGLRPAAGPEIPHGKRRGEVFVVKLAPVH